MVFAILFGLVNTVYAQPPIPSSFYGEVHFNDGPSRVGHTIGAWVPGNSSAVASTTVIDLSGNLVYSINIPGDIPETAGVKEGGVEGDEITFIMDSRIIAKGTWHKGTNVSLNIHPPLPLLGSSVGGTVGIPINFSGSASDWGTDAVLFEWDFDSDGVYDDGAGQTPSYTWLNVGSYPVRLKVTDAQGGEGTNSIMAYIDPAPITVTADSGLSKVFGTAEDPTFTYVSSDPSVTFSGVLSRVTGENVGAYAITQGSLSAGSNYSITFVPANFNITPKPITVTVTPGQTKEFGAGEPAFAYTSSDLAASFTGALARDAGENVGAYAINQGDLSAGTNYSITFVPANFNITPKPITVTVTPGQTKVFGAGEPTFTYTSSDLAASFTGALARAAGEDVGAYAINQGDLSAGTNYSISFVPANFNITPKPITVTVTPGQTKVFGAGEPTFTYTSSDLAVSFTGALARAAGEDVGVYAINQGDLSAGTNYSISFVPADFNITPKPITVTVTPGQTKVFGAGEPAFAYTSSDLAVSFTGALVRDAGENVGTYAINQGDLTAGTNYSITFVPANFNITPKAASVILSNLSYIYDGSVKSVTVTTDPIGLSNSVTYNGSTTEPSAAGSYAVIATITDPNYTGSATDTMVISAFHSIALVPGWNLVSFSLHPTNTAVANVLASVAGNFDLVYAWDATGGHVGGGNWMRADNIGGTTDTLLNLDETMGFWIHMTTADTLEVVGSVPGTSNISLATTAGGWNLVGYPSAGSGLLPGSLTAHSTMVYAYHAGDTGDPWKLHDTIGAPYANDLNSLTAGWGYWLYVTLLKLGALDIRR